MDILEELIRKELETKSRYYFKTNEFKNTNLDHCQIIIEKNFDIFSWKRYYNLIIKMKYPPGNKFYDPDKKSTHKYYFTFDTILECLSDIKNLLDKTKYKIDEDGSICLVSKNIKKDDILIKSAFNL